jgi:hypothetical protein
MTLELVQHVFPLLMGPLVAGLVETAKRVPVIPFGGRRKAGIIAALVVVSLLVRLVLAWATGGLEVFAWEAELRIAFDAVAAALVAAGGYSIAKPDRG